MNSGPFYIYLIDSKRVLVRDSLNSSSLVEGELTQIVRTKQALEVALIRLQNQGLTIIEREEAVVPHAEVLSQEQIQKIGHRFKKGHSHNVGRRHGVRMRYKCSIAKKGKPSHWKGASWFHNPFTDESHRFKPGKQPPGWVRGRSDEWRDDAKVYIRRRWKSPIVNR